VESIIYGIQDGFSKAYSPVEFALVSGSLSTKHVPSLANFAAHKNGFKLPTQKQGVLDL
jgi:hypothetical protein